MVTYPNKGLSRASEIREAPHRAFHKLFCSVGICESYYDEG